MNFKESQYITSVLSLVARLPPFDFEEYNGYYYLNIKSE